MPWKTKGGSKNSWGPSTPCFCEAYNGFEKLLVPLWFLVCALDSFWRKWKPEKQKTHYCMRWMPLEVEPSLVVVFKTITFVTVAESSASASWSSSSPDMAFNFPLQRPIFCPAKKSPKWDHQLCKKPAISWLEEQAATEEFTRKYFSIWSTWEDTQLWLWAGPVTLSSLNWCYGRNAIPRTGADTKSSPLLLANCTVHF